MCGGYEEGNRGMARTWFIFQPLWFQKSDWRDLLEWLLPWTLLSTTAFLITAWVDLKKIHRFGAKYITAFSAGYDSQNAKSPLFTRYGPPGSEKCYHALQNCSCQVWLCGWHLQCYIACPSKNIRWSLISLTWILCLHRLPRWQRRTSSLKYVFKYRRWEQSYYFW